MHLRRLRRPGRPAALPHRLQGACRQRLEYFVDQSIRPRRIRHGGAFGRFVPNHVHQARSCCRSNDAGALARAASSIAISAGFHWLAALRPCWRRCSRRRYPMRPKTDPGPALPCRGAIASRYPNPSAHRLQALAARRSTLTDSARTAIIAIAPGEIVHPVQRVHDLGRLQGRAAWTAHADQRFHAAELLGLPVGHAVR